MKKHHNGKVMVTLALAAILLGGTAALGKAMSAAQTAADQSLVMSSAGEAGAAKNLPAIAGEQRIEDIPGFYQGQSTTANMPYDLTLGKKDVPMLMERLKDSSYLAVYTDKELSVHVTKEALIQTSTDAGATWKDADTQAVPPEEFALWLLQNDPIPGYSMKQLQSRLENGAQVWHLVVREGKELYFVMDGGGVQIELVQVEKEASLLLDGQRMMLTSVQVSPFLVSEEVLDSFYELLVSDGILAETEEEKFNAEVMPWIESDRFIMTP